MLNYQSKLLKAMYGIDQGQFLFDQAENGSRNPYSLRYKHFDLCTQ
ncbi:hypothetical protein PL10110_580033 [Planktothrix agardhii]|nr:hypothetical protein PL10110_580033 [Planktothrix agardhii]